ncbi:MAG: hypothetical protein HZA77_02220 [Candidatus Schekmanbacteria bacterium]|nr:hypothetical protein [Candidatus Schekmanbacteria bacterium]
MNKTQQNFFVTSNSELNYLLDEDMCQGILGRGIYIPQYNFHDQNRPMGINIVISGPPGIGKTSLALEILCRLQKISCSKSSGRCPTGSINENENGVVAYISIEQSSVTIEKTAKMLTQNNKKGIALTSCGYKSFDKKIKIKNLQFEPTGGGSTSYDGKMGRPYLETYNKITEDADKYRTLLLPKLSPRFYSQLSHENERIVFWERFKQLCRLCENASWSKGDWETNKEEQKNELKENTLLAMAVDSLNAFGQEQLNREQIYQLFRLVTWSGILGIFIYEEADNSHNSDSFLNEVSFLTDIHIKLSWNTLNYTFKQIEVTKSRYQRHVLGKHPFKIRNNGLVIYPSLHTQIAKQERWQRKFGNDLKVPKSDFGITLAKDKKNNTNTIPKSNSIFKIRDDSFILIKGARNTNKLAISMPYLYSYLSNKDNQKEEENRNVMIINFGPEIQVDNLHPNKTIKKINYQEVPKFKHLINCNWSSDDKSKSIDDEKYRIEKYLYPGTKKAIFIVSFNTGYLMPEQCISFILQEVKIRAIQRIVFLSTYHLPLRFPLLAADSTFLPYLIRIMKIDRRGLLIITLDENEALDQFNKEIRGGLESSADYIVQSVKKEDRPNFVELNIRKIVERNYGKYKATVEFN